MKLKSAIIKDKNKRATIYRKPDFADGSQSFVVFSLIVTE